MRFRHLHSLLLCFITGAFHAQSIVGFEYFIDRDPGVGSATYIDAVANQDSLLQEIVITETDTLSPGFHFVGIRALDESGLWGHYVRRSFKIDDPLVPVIDTSFKKLVAYEYFIDNDPGVGNGVFIPLQNISDNNETEITIPETDTLLPGFHFVGIRALDESGQWGHYVRRSFKIDDPLVPVIDTTFSKITGYEYFFDNDPGVGNGVFVALVTPQDFDTTEIAISGTDTLSLGFHFVGVRALDEKGEWGHYTRRSFIVNDLTQQSRLVDTNSYPVVGYEYFFDDVDPGVGNATFVEFEKDSFFVKEEIVISTDGLLKGEHKLTFRLKDSSNLWSHNQTEVFEICISPLPAIMPSFAQGGTFCSDEDTVTYKASGSPTGQYNWYTKSSGGEPINNRFNVEFTDSFFTRIGLTESEVLYVATKAPGCNSSRLRVEGNVVPEINAPSVKNETRCGEGIITFTPESGAPEGGTYRWYESDTSQVPFFIGDALVTDTIKQSRSFSVESISEGGVCKSKSRVSPIAVIRTCIPQQIVLEEIPDVIFGLDEPIALRAFTTDLDGNRTNQDIFYRITEGRDRAFIRNDSLFYTGIGVVIIEVGSITDTNYVYSDASVVIGEFKITADAAQVAILSNSPVCAGERLTLSPTLIKDGNYEWVTPSGERIDERLLSIFPVTEADSGLYRLFVRTPLDTLFSSVLVEVNPEPEKIVLDSTKIAGCANKRFLLTGVGGQFEQYNWHLNGGVLQTTDTAVFSPVQTGSYHLVALDTNLCASGTSPLYINLNPDSIPTITFDDAEGKLISSPGVSYKWYINNLLISGGSQQELSLTLNGDYKVEVIDILGCVSFSNTYEVDQTDLLDLSKLTNESTNEGILQEQITVFPQPANQKLNISLFSFEEPKDHLFRLYNVQGKVMLEERLTQITTSTYFKSLDVSQLGAGLYYLKIPSLNFIKTQKVVIE